MRVIPMKPPTFNDFNLPEQLKEIGDIKNGIVWSQDRPEAEKARPWQRLSI